MSTDQPPVDFATVADVFLAHGSLQSPAFLDGQLSARLALADIDAEAWLTLVCESLGVEEPRSRDEAQVLLAWRAQARERLSAAEMSFEPLLPDELFSLSERAQALREWCQGFNEVVEDVDEEQRGQWPAMLTEALGDLGQMTAIETDLADTRENENDLFALTDHARMAALMLYTEQHPGRPQVEQPEDDSHSATRH
ncbi:UPF0149 family protein [Kushneria phosphatilytica]|uniref:UPF0149 family protein n=1 Tax=Kushneria phosphatilytica TaxID=657387 RepID=A0A1S1NSL7_9GAMM|nr:UPF0149 family protein [Kushneria phosphatilytica]OHV09014.1 hypothetical protein BH688_13240 [Kushneria phosphatilytica]QEL12641.1 UPF0149 family protein [Kushneria phosphatilytica]